MQDKKRLMIDMDDVITKGGFLYLINKFLRTSYQESDFKNDFYMQSLIPNIDEFFDFFKTKNQYDYAVMLPNAYEVLKELNEKYDLYIATSYVYKEIPYESGHILEQKHEYLKQHLPFINPNNYIFITNKILLDCDIKIDDRMINLGNAERKILFTAYHNNNISDQELASKGIERALDWLDIKKKLL